MKTGQSARLGARVDPAAAMSANAAEAELHRLGLADSIDRIHALIGCEYRIAFPLSLSARQDFAPRAAETLLAALGRGRGAKSDAPRRALRGRILRVLGRRSAALAEFAAALKAEPRNARALGWRAELLLSTEGNSSAAAAALAAAAEADPSSPFPETWAAAALLAESANSTVHALLDQALGKDPDFLPGLLLRAVARERSGRMEDAARDARRAVDVAPTLGAAQLVLGRLCARSGRIEEAERAFAAATRLDPDGKFFYGQIVLADRPLGNNVLDRRSLDAYIAAHPQAAWAFALRGDMILNQDKDQVGPALADLGRAFELDGKTPWIGACLARAEVQLLRSESGVPRLEAAIDKDPGCAWLHSWLGESHRLLGRRDEAIRCFRRSIKAAPRFAQVHVWLGRVLGERGAWEEAVSEFSAAIELDCEYAFAYAKRGDALGRLGLVREALADFDRATALNSIGAPWIAARRAEITARRRRQP
jgi:tetratricopeptide (TPR) repeat protein